MQMEDLTKTQIVLLTLLVSFVTSIATGIVTVSLVDRAPSGLTQTIHRVVERTVEKVTPEIVDRPGTITKETTVVVKEDDLITGSIEKNGRSLVRIRRAGEGTSEAGAEAFVGLGVILPGGIIATDASLLAPGASYVARLDDGMSIALKRLDTPKGFSTALLAVSADASTSAQSIAARAATFADMGALKLGQTVITLSGRERTTVGIGIVAGLEYNLPPGVSDPKEEEVLSVIGTTISGQESAPGSPLINIFGELVGIAVRDASGKEEYISGNLLAAQLSAVRNKGASASVVEAMEGNVAP